MLKQRVITAMIGLVIVLGILYFAGSHIWSALVWLVSIGCGYEFASMLGHRLWSIPTFWMLVVISAIQWLPNVTLNVFAAILLITLAIPVVLKNRVTTSQLATVLVGSLYIGFGCVRLSAIRYFPQGDDWILLVLVTIWATDTAAYFTGRAFKGPKLWPEISPKKTLSGALGGVVGGAIAATCVGRFSLGLQVSSTLVVLGVAVSLVGQFGDLVESAYKRTSGVKDSGNLLPGHGGLLDRLDSLIFAAPVAYYIISTHFVS